MADKIEFEVVSHVDEFMEAVVGKMPLILKSIGMTCEWYAKEDCPVDTCLLRLRYPGKLPKLPAIPPTSLMIRA